MTGKDSEIRRRSRKPKGGNKKGGKDDNDKNAATPAPSSSPTNNPEQSERRQDDDEQETFWQTLTSHWLLRYFIPIYLVYIGLQKIEQQGITFKTPKQWILQDAEWINEHFPFLHLRQSVGHNDERQLLVVGSMSSGTRQVAASLDETLGLEMGHERSDTLSYYVRDGTISWFFVIRFLDKPISRKQIVALCSNASFKVGFHPRMYRGGICSEQEQWSPCWVGECVGVLQQEWACAANNNKGCQFQPFRRTLHQTRHPVHVVESLVAKFCHNPDKTNSFIRISRILFGDSKHNNNDFDGYSCLEVVSHPVIEYNKALLAAREKGHIYAMYKVEDTTPCDVAELAGFIGTTNDDVVYEPNKLKVQSKCHSNDDDSNNNNPGRQLMKPKKKYKVNQDRVRLDWTDFEGGKHNSQRPVGDMALVNEMKELTQSLGYDLDLANERVI